MMPLDSYSDWIRPYEARRRSLGISGRALSKMAGYSPAWWSWLSPQHTPPRGWAKLERKLAKLMKMRGGAWRRRLR